MFYQGAHEMHCALAFTCSKEFLHDIKCSGRFLHVFTCFGRFYMFESAPLGGGVVVLTDEI